MKCEFVIIGAGVAGICAANRLADLGKNPLVIEGGDYPTLKVCGEFLSPECIDQLIKWGAKPTTEIQEARFEFAGKTLTFTLPKPAASMFQMERDTHLLDYARNHSVTVMTNTKVTHLDYVQDHTQITLSTGEVLLANHILFATGRLPQFSKGPPKITYVGMKNYIKGMHLGNRLEMYGCNGAYFGLVTVKEDLVNLVCLAKKGIESPEQLIAKHPRLQEYLSNHELKYSKWLTCQIPGFGVKKVPKWPNGYFLGDAAGSIPPITGDGVGMALTSGVLAANYAVQGDPEGYKKAWQHHYRSHIRYGMLLHSAMLNPTYASLLMEACIRFPKLSERFYSLTRG